MPNNITFSENTQLLNFAENSQANYFDQSLTDLARNNEKTDELNFKGRELSSDDILGIAKKLENATKHAAHFTSIDLSNTGLGKIEPEELKYGMQVLATAIKHYNFVSIIQSNVKSILKINLCENQLTYEPLQPLIACAAELHAKQLPNFFLDLRNNCLDNNAAENLLKYEGISANIRKNKIQNKVLKKTLKEHLESNTVESNTKKTNINALYKEWSWCKKLDNMEKRLSQETPAVTSNLIKVTFTSKGLLKTISIAKDAIKKDPENLGNLIKDTVNKALTAQRTERFEETNENLNNRKIQLTKSSKKSSSLTFFSFDNTPVNPNKNSSVPLFTDDEACISSTEGNLKVMIIDGLIREIKIPSELKDRKILGKNLVSAINAVIGAKIVASESSPGPSSSGESYPTPYISQVISKTFLSTTKQDSQQTTDTDSKPVNQFN